MNLEKIAQIDRDAAAAFAAQTSGAAITDPQIQACISGKMDDSLVVQHFARHRQLSAAAERARTDWQPIETAPRDGTVLWAYGTIRGDYGYTEDRLDMVKTRWDASSKGWRFAQPMARHDPFGWEPTHWMPLPAPPADAIERGEV